MMHLEGQKYTNARIAVNVKITWMHPDYVFISFIITRIDGNTVWNHWKEVPITFIVTCAQSANKSKERMNEEQECLQFVIFAIQHHELRGVLNRDERLPEDFVADLFYDIDLKEGTLDQKKSIETTNSVTVPEAVKSQEPTKKVSEPVKKHEPAQKEISSNKKAPEPSNRTPIATKKAPELSKKVPEPTRGRRPKAA